jgi:outer membrane protein assembly factor BamE (lipoprotein component of BamABCDE complex)
LVCFGIALLTGCVSAGTQVKESALEQFQKGITTRSDVEKALGPPQSNILLADGTRIIIYSGVHAQARASTFIPVVGAFVGGVDAHSSAVTFTFDKDGKLTNYSSTQSDIGTRSGIGAGSQQRAADPKVVK